MAETVEIWRLEALDGEGAFRSGEARTAQAALPYTRDPYRHPSPTNDIPGCPDLGKEPEGKWLCGCRNRRQLKQWFPERGLRAVANTAQVAVYEVPATLVRWGTYQGIFVVAEATRKRTLHPLDLCRLKVAL